MEMWRQCCSVMYRLVLEYYVWVIRYEHERALVNEYEEDAKRAGTLRANWCDRHQNNR